MKLLFNIIIFIITINNSFSQSVSVYPTNWWVGMKMNKIQLLLKSDVENIDDKNIEIKYSGIKIIKRTNFKNKKYVALDISILPNAKVGISNIEFSNENEKFKIPFELKPRRKGNGTEYAQGLNSTDLIYLIMPDRFANGDKTNDKVEGMLDQSLRRDTVFNRHGGDLKGIQNHLDYIKDLGITSIWLNPVIENDMPNRTEHGYAFTNHYKIDRRLGGEIAYKNLINESHKNGLKIIQDAVYNHVGIEHILYKEMPDSSWFHWWPKYTNTTFKDQTIFDPHAANADVLKMKNGWFAPQMPDWNQQNEFVANYLIQHAIWIVEEFGIDAWRIDTYAYNDLNFMNRCNAALMLEYPKIFLFGETWVHGVPNQSYFTQNIYDQKFKSNLLSVTDFQALWGILDVVKKDFGWTEGVNLLYTTLAQDFVYKNANNNVVFLDNHDINRFFSECNEDVNKYKMALGWLLTTRGIPQIYYGDELATKGFTNPNDGWVRLDFKGGWEGDKENNFESSGRNELQNDVFNYFKKIANYRKQSNAITLGNLIQYVPEDAVYVYFKQYKNELVMVLMNTAKEKKVIDLTRFKDQLQNYKTFKNIITDIKLNIENKLSLESNTSTIFEVK